MRRKLTEIMIVLCAVLSNLFALRAARYGYHYHQWPAMVSNILAYLATMAPIVTDLVVTRPRRWRE